MILKRIASLALSGALAAACSQQPASETDESTAPPPPPQVSARVVEGYADLGGRVLDVALMPNARQPYLGRGFAATDAGGFEVIDLAQGGVTHLDGPRVGALAAAPDFQLRGAPAPLLIGAGGALTGPRAWVYLADEDAIVEMPLAPMDTEGVVTGLCLDRADEMFVNLIVLTDRSIERWRMIDDGGDALSVERTELIEDAPALSACAPRGREIIGVASSGATKPIVDATWGFSDGTDVAGLENDNGLWTVVARPNDSSASLIGPNTKDVALAFEEGFNAPVMPSPALVAASTANFGGSYSSGVLLVAKDDAVNVVELGGALSAAMLELSRGS